MKIEFDSLGTDYLEIGSITDDIITITISARNPEDTSMTIVNSASITKEQLVDICKELGIL